MIDFTLKAYIKYLEVIKLTYSNILRFDEYFVSDPKPNTFCLIRHDVDRRPLHALDMARVENKMGVNATYFFRAKPLEMIKWEILSALV